MNDSIESVIRSAVPDRPPAALDVRVLEAMAREARRRRWHGRRNRIGFAAAAATIVAVSLAVIVGRGSNERTDDVGERSPSRYRIVEHDDADVQRPEMSRTFSLRRGRIEVVTDDVVVEGDVLGARLTIHENSVVEISVVEDSKAMRRRGIASVGVATIALTMALVIVEVDRGEVDVEWSDGDLDRLVGPTIIERRVASMSPENVTPSGGQVAVSSPSTSDVAHDRTTPPTNPEVREPESISDRPRDDHGLVTGSVVDEDGFAVSGAVVMLRREEASDVVTRFATGTDGRFVSRSVRAGRHHVQVLRGERAPDPAWPVSSPYWVPSDQGVIEVFTGRTTYAELRLRRDGRIVGEVEFWDAKRAREAPDTISLYRATSKRRQLDVVTTRGIDRRGRFRLDGVAPGHYLVRRKVEDRVEDRFVVVSANRETKVDFRTMSSRSKWRVRRDRRPVPGALVTSVPTKKRDDTLAVVTPRSANDAGIVKVDGMSVDRYAVLVEDVRDRRRFVARIHVGRGGRSQALDWPEDRLEVVMGEAGGNFPIGTRLRLDVVSAYRVDFTAHFTRDERGVVDDVVESGQESMILSELGRGRYVLTVTKPNMEPSTYDVTIRGASNRVVVD